MIPNNTAQKSAYNFNLSVQMSECRSVQQPGCPKTESQNTRVSYRSVQMSKRPKVCVSECWIVKKSKYSIVHMSERPNVQVSDARLSGSTWPALLNSGPPVPGQVQSPRLRGGSGGPWTGRLRGEGRSSPRRGRLRGSQWRLREARSPMGE